MPITKTAIFLALAWLIATAPTAGAYIGPGAGLSVIGTALAFVGAVAISQARARKMAVFVMGMTSRSR